MLTRTDIEEIQIIVRSKKNRFIDIFEMTPMDPKVDCQYADLRGTNFSRQDLREFDFRGSDLTGSRFQGALFSDATFQNAKMIKFEDEKLEELINADPVARYLAQRSLLARAYYERIVSICIFFMFYDFSKYNELSDMCLSKTNSTYIRSMIKIIEELHTNDNDTRNVRLGIAKNLITRSYPLDRRKLLDQVRWHVAKFPNLAAYFK